MQDDQFKSTSSPLSKVERNIYQGILQPVGFPGLPAGWISDWETFASSDGALQLFGVNHHPEKWTGHRALIILHGLGEHGGRYLHFPHYLHDTVDAVYCLDHRGHGRSEGLRGHVERFELFADDVALTIRREEETLKKRFGKAEIHLFGHSFGSLIALRTILSHPNLPLSSVSLSSPFLGIRVEVPLAKKVAAHALSRMWGSLQMANELSPTDVSHDPEVVQAYVKDRLVHKKATPRLYTEMINALSDTMKRNNGIEYPLLFLVPLEDRIVDCQASQKFFRALKNRDKQLKTYPELYHESFNEIGKEKPFEDLKQWIRAHSSRS